MFATFFSCTDEKVGSSRVGPQLLASTQPTNWEYEAQWDHGSHSGRRWGPNRMVRCLNLLGIDHEHAKETIGV